MLAVFNYVSLLLDAEVYFQRLCISHLLRNPHGDNWISNCGRLSNCLECKREHATLVKYSPVGVPLSGRLWEIRNFSCSVKLQAKEKRGWTLNSAGYLLGPRE